MSKSFRILSAGAALLGALVTPRAPLAAQRGGAAELGALVQGLGVSARVLMIGAHPDDEDTQLITWLAKGRHVETAYLSLTRGDGGQNLLGNELGEALGAIRTEELLAARRIDGGRQYFTRAFDFGFSKTSDETFAHWPHDSILRDVITVVRAFRPHVITSVFSGTPRDGHGHHQVAGILAREAYELAGDTVRFPRSATNGHGPWTVPKFYRRPRGDSATIRMNVGEYDPLLGRSYAELAGESRSQHKSQAFGALELKGVRWFELRRMGSRVPAPGDATREQSIFDGIDTSWARLRGALASPAATAQLELLPDAFDEVLRRFTPFDPAPLVAPLVRAQQLLNVICAAPANGATDGCAGPTRGPTSETGTTIDVARRRVDEALALATGIAVEATTDRTVWALGERIPVRVTTYNRGRFAVRVSASIRSEAGEVPAGPERSPALLLPDSSRTDTASITLARPSQPWWLAQGRTGAIFATPTSGVAENSQLRLPLTASVIVRFEGAVFPVTVPVVYRHADAIRGEVNDVVAGAPAISVLLDDEVEYAPANAPLQRAIRVHLRSAAGGPRDATVSLTLPNGLLVDSARRTVTLAGTGATQTLTFNIRGRLPAGRHSVEAVATSGGERFASGYTLVDYEHIRPQRLYRPSRLAFEAIDARFPASLRVAYIAGVGDNVAPALEQLGVAVTALTPEMLPRIDLSGFGAIVVGPRAYEASAALVANNGRLLDYARNGGTLVVQYGQYEMMQPGVMPYPITINRPHDRVTLEDAPVRIIDSTATLLRAPNRITAADFAGWQQDRSLYMPRSFDNRYQPVIEMSDPGEPPNRGGILVAPYGRGTYVYTTLAFFRQLPNGVPGAARLFVNLLAAKAGRVQ